MSLSKQKAQEKAKYYIKDHNLEKIVAEMMNSTLISKTTQPLIFMVSLLKLFTLFQIKYLANLISEADLTSNGISVVGTLP